MDNSTWVSYKNSPSPELKKKIILEHLKLVHYVIHYCIFFKEELTDSRDFFQFGIEGLNEAIERFDPQHGTKFETYAIKRIKGKIFDQWRKIEKKSTKNGISLNQPFGNEDDEYLEIPDQEKLPDELFEDKILKKELITLIENLDYVRKQIIELYYWAELSYKEIAEILNITVSRVSQIHSEIMEHFRKKLIK